MPTLTSKHGHDISGTTTARPSNVDTGEQYFNTTTSRLNVYNGSAWVPMASGYFEAAAASGAITAKEGTVFITKAGVAALTLADPTAITDDGKILRFVSTTANAHTISNAAGSGFNVAGAAGDVATLGGAIGDGLTLQAYQGKWYVIGSINATLG